MAQRSVRPDGLDTSVGALRSPSISSDVRSNSTKSFNNAVPLASPPPAYIAATGASSLISSELDRTVVTSPQALDLVNEFLDQVLFNILATAKSVSLGALRAAVPSVLKPRLGKAAVRAAEDDLQEYLEDEEEAELATRKGGVESKGAFDTELAWKLARLRCMVYAQLGDLEEEDEEEWLEKDQLLEHLVSRGDGQADIELNPPAAIFLASVIEFLGEQALHYAAQHAQKRLTMARVQGTSEAGTAAGTLTPKTDELVVEGKDMNHVGRDSPLSRLWRSWRRNTRDANNRAFSPDVAVSPGFHSVTHSRNGSQVPGIEQIAEEQSPSQIPLPLGLNDIDEIEVPGLAPLYSDAEDDDDFEFIEHEHRRPSSMVFFPGSYPVAPPPEIVEEEDEVVETPVDTVRPQLSRQRSMSSPPPRKLHYTSWVTYVPPTVEPVNEPSEEGHSGSVKDEDVFQDARTDQDASDHAPQTPRSGQSSHSRRSSLQANRRGRTSPREPGSPNKRDGMVGNAIAAAMGAAGAAGAATLAENEEKISAAKAHEPQPLPGPKRTVAEEMLGGQNAVKPPRDARTGSSITNVSDFDSMYVPMQMPSAAEKKSMPPVAVASTKEPATHQPSASQGSLSRHVETLPQPPINVEELPEEPMTRSAPRPPRTGQPEHAELPAPRSGRTSINTAVAAVPEPEADSPVSPIPANDYRPQTADSNISDDELDQPTGPSTVVHSNPLHSNPVQTQTAYQRPAYSHHSNSSSSSSHILGFTRDAAGKPQTISQQNASGGRPDSTRMAQPFKPVYGGKDIRSSTASSSTGRLVGKMPASPNPAVNNIRSQEIDAEKKKSLEILIRSNETLHYTLTPANVMQSTPSTPESQDTPSYLRTTDPTESSRYSRVSSGPVSSNRPDSTINRNTLLINATDRTMSPSLRSRNPVGEARDARPERGSAVRDLADYARSTGPANESQLPQPLSPRLVSSGPSRVPMDNQVKPPAPNKPRNRIKLEARDARPSRTADNSDLIDFIREGPPRQAGDHRIDRRVAPFRTTMDSEDLNSLAPQVERQSTAAYSATSTYDERPRNGIGSTYNSQSQLNQKFNDDGGMPKRTRRRVKDPYAIDDSDEDEYLEQGSRPQPSNEESLIDFLRNTAPPPGSDPQPLLGARPPYHVDPKSVNATAGGARDDVPRLTQTGSKMDKYRPTQSTHAAHIDRNRSKPQYEAREARPRRNDTSELAEYLKFSGPAPSAEFTPQPFDIPQTQNYQQKGDTGMRRMFTKRKGK